MSAQQKVDVELSGPFGSKAKVFGLTGEQIMLFLVFAILAAILYTLIQSDRDRELRYSRVEQFYAKMFREFEESRQRDLATHATQKFVLDAINGVKEEQRGTTYVLTLSEAERRALKLQMPAVLRDRVQR